MENKKFIILFFAFGFLMIGVRFCTRVMEEMEKQEKGEVRVEDALIKSIEEHNEKSGKPGAMESITGGLLKRDKAAGSGDSQSSTPNSPLKMLDLNREEKLDTPPPEDDRLGYVKDPTILKKDDKSSFYPPTQEEYQRNQPEQDPYRNPYGMSGTGTNPKDATNPFYPPPMNDTPPNIETPLDKDSYVPLPENKVEYYFANVYTYDNDGKRVPMPDGRYVIDSPKGGKSYIRVRNGKKKIYNN